MAEICHAVVSDEKEASPSAESSSQAARRRRTEIRKVKFVGGVPKIINDHGFKEARLSTSRGCNGAVESSSFSDLKPTLEDADTTDVDKPTADLVSTTSNPPSSGDAELFPKFGVSSVCGRRREMEDAVAIHPSFLEDDADLHYFGVYDGNGCSHVCYLYTQLLN